MDKVLCSGPKGEFWTMYTVLSSGPKGEFWTMYTVLSSGPEGEFWSMYTVLCSGPEGEFWTMYTVLSSGPEGEFWTMYTVLSSGPEERVLNHVYRSKFWTRGESSEPSGVKDSRALSQERRVLLTQGDFQEPEGLFWTRVWRLHKEKELSDSSGS